MKSSSLFFVLLASSTVLFAGCAMSGENGFDAEQFDVPLETAGYGGTNEPPTGLNGLDPDCFWDHGTQEALRLLGSAGLDQGNGELPKLPMVKNQCREIIESAVACALDQKQVVVDVDTGDKYQGWWGLATTWEQDPLDWKQGSWVSACIMQRLNANGHVNILLEGNHPAIEEDPASTADFPFEESMIFGNIFDSRSPLYTGRPAFYAYVCAEPSVIQACGHTAPDAIDTRVCDDARLAGTCGLIYMGDCASVCVPNGPYWTCNYGGMVLELGVRVQLQYNPHPSSVCY